MILKVHPLNPEKRIVERIVQGFKKGEIFILPTDTVYALVCSLDAPKAINELYRIKNLPESHYLSLLCRDVAMASQYALNISSPVFRLMKSVTPGPYTFILKANRSMDRRGTGKRKTVGVRIVDHPLHRMLMEMLDEPLVSTSITSQEEFRSDPEDLDRLYGSRVSAIIDGGIRQHEFSTILDCTEGIPQMVRKGIGEVTGIENDGGSI